MRTIFSAAFVVGALIAAPAFAEDPKPAPTKEKKAPAKDATKDAAKDAPKTDTTKEPAKDAPATDATAPAPSKEPAKDKAPAKHK